MIKLYIYPRLEGAADSKLLRLFLSKNEVEGKIFQQVPTAPFTEMVEFVGSVGTADYILLAHEYYFIKQEDSYLSELDQFAASHNKKIIVFDYGDVVDEVKLKNSVVLRTAGYKSSLQPNEIIIPPFVEDIGVQFSAQPIQHKPQLPKVGFVGMVKLPSLWQEIKYQVRILKHQLQILIGKSQQAELQGLYFRRRVIKQLQKSIACVTNFIIRNSFSAHEKTITMDPKVLRQEYVDTIASSDLNLIVRGDGNYSLRFFEVLSMGRVPLFIDTDTPLPLEGEISYDDFMLRIDHREINNISKKIQEFWDTLTEEKYIAMQKTARMIFETQLRTDVFYKNLFDRLVKEVRN